MSQSSSSNLSDYVFPNVIFISWRGRFDLFSLVKTPWEVIMAFNTHTFIDAHSQHANIQHLILLWMIYYPCVPFLIARACARARVCWDVCVCARSHVLIKCRYLLKKFENPLIIAMCDRDNIRWGRICNFKR